MKAKFWGLIGFAIVAVVAELYVLGLFSPFSVPIEEQPEAIFHVTLADPELYQDGIFSDFFQIQEGTYVFRFVPNGDSPQELSISLEGESFSVTKQTRVISVK